VKECFSLNNAILALDVGAFFFVFSGGMMENELLTHLRVLSVASTLTIDRKNKYEAFPVNFLALSNFFFLINLLMILL